MNTGSILRTEVSCPDNELFTAKAIRKINLSWSGYFPMVSTGGSHPPKNFRLSWKCVPSNECWLTYIVENRPIAQPFVSMNKGMLENACESDACHATKQIDRSGHWHSITPQPRSFYRICRMYCNIPLWQLNDATKLGIEFVNFAWIFVQTTSFDLNNLTYRSDTAIRSEMSSTESKIDNNNSSRIASSFCA